MPIIEYKDEGKYIQFKVPVLIPQVDVEKQGSFKIPKAFQQQILITTIQLTEEYPKKCPSICLPPNLIYHPYIAQDSGSVCMDTRSDKWSASEATKTLLRILTVDIAQLLGTFEGENPHNQQADNEYKQNPDQYFETANKIFAQHVRQQCPLSQFKKLMQLAEVKEYPEPFKQQAIQCQITLPDLSTQKLKKLVQKEYVCPFINDEYSGSI